MERVLDIVLSLLCLLLLSPFLILIILMLRFTGEGEVFFVQERIGKSGKPFKLYKFATMLKDSPNINTGTITIRNDQRILSLGRFLRKSKINELPQLINILLGTMSVVGPRPQARDNFNSYPASAQELIVQVKPGLSGIGSIIFRDEEEMLDHYVYNRDLYENLIMPYKGKLEAWYVKNQSLYIYITIIFITIWVIFFPKSKLGWKILKDLPVPPDRLKVVLNYPSL